MYIQYISYNECLYSELHLKLLYCSALQISTDKMIWFSEFPNYFNPRNLKGIYKRGIFMALKVSCRYASTINCFSLYISYRIAGNIGE